MTSIKLKEIYVDLPIIGERTIKWPEDDLYLIKWTHLIDQVLEVLSFVEDRRVCVQAGGACGLWPLALSGFFETVYTFEPHIPNFRALTHNCIETENVIAMNAALGDHNGTVGLKWDDGCDQNLGAQYIKKNGIIPMLTVDSLSLDSLDLIYLDVEGFEWSVIMGAEESILKHRPVVVYENREHCERFGHTKKMIMDFFKSNGYRIASTLSRNDDAVMVP